jgi:hypothetical protein
MFSPRLGDAAGVALAILAVVAPVTAQDLDYSGSLQYSTGEYFLAQRSSSLFFSNTLGLSAGRLRFSASVPLILQKAPWVLYTSGSEGGMGASGSMEGAGSEITVDTATQQQIGLGDPMLFAGFEVLGGPGAPMSLRLTGNLKVPLGDVERGFSTGAWDYAAGLSLSGVLAGTLLFADVAYWIFGDPPGLEYRDPVAYSAGFGRPLFGGKLGLMAALYGYTEVIDGVTPPVQASVSVSYLIDWSHSLMGGVSFGLTDSSPDIAFSLGWSVALAGLR